MCVKKTLLCSCFVLKLTGEILWTGRVKSEYDTEVYIYTKGTVCSYRMQAETEVCLDLSLRLKDEYGEKFIK